MDGARRDSSPPSGVRAPSPSAAPPSPTAPRAPRSTLASPRRAPATDGHTVTLGGRAHRPPSPRAHAHTPLRRPPPPLPAHAAPPSPVPSLPYRLTGAAREPTSRRDVKTTTGPPPPAGVPGLLPHSCPPPPPRPHHARAAPAVLCRPHKNPRTPGPHQQCCGSPTRTPARQGRTSSAVQAPQKPPHATAAPAVLCRPHRHPRTPGPHQQCCAAPTGTPARQGRTSSAVQAPKEPPHARAAPAVLCRPHKNRAAPPHARARAVQGHAGRLPPPLSWGIGAPQVPEQVVPPSSPPTPPPSRTGRVTLPPAAGEGSRVTHTGGSSLLRARAPPPLHTTAAPTPPAPRSLSAHARPA